MDNPYKWLRDRKGKHTGTCASDRSRLVPISTGLSPKDVASLVYRNGLGHVGTCYQESTG